MIIVSGTLRLRPESVAALREIAQATLRETRREKGCIVYSFAEDLLEPGLIRIYEEWETMADLDAHGRTPHIEAWREAVRAQGPLGRELKTVEAGATAPLD